MTKRRRTRQRPITPAGPSPAATASPRSRILLLAAIGVPVVLIVLLGIAALGGGSVPTASPSPSPSAATGPVPSGEAMLVRPDSPTLGPADAPVTLVEFLDPECEACRAFFPEVKQVMADYEGQVRLVIRYIPGHGNSALAAVALEAARAQDTTKYWEMMELLFDRQKDWGEQSDPQTQAFLDAAAAVGLDVAPIQAAMDAGDLSMVERDLADALAFDVQGTPTFFVNGTKVTDQSPAGLRAAIDAALAG